MRFVSMAIRLQVLLPSLVPREDCLLVVLPIQVTLFYVNSPVHDPFDIMLLGYNTNGFAHHRLEDALMILSKLGYSSIAIALDHYVYNPHASSKEIIRNVRVLLETLHLRAVIESG